MSETGVYCQHNVDVGHCIICPRPSMYTPPCECGKPFCAIPFAAPDADWKAWWDQHPARKAIRPLSVEAARRKGGPL